jgi:hypothetical protein
VRRAPKPGWLLFVLGMVAIRSAVVGAIVAGALALLADASFWPAYLICFGVFLASGALRWARGVREYRDQFRQRFGHGRPGDEDDRPGSGGVREPLPSRGPRSPLQAAADPDQSTGPSAIP